MTFIADLFAKLRTPKNVVRYMSKESRFKGSFDWQHGKRVQTLLQSEKRGLIYVQKVPFQTTLWEATW